MTNRNDPGSSIKHWRAWPESSCGDNLQAVISHRVFHHPTDIHKILSTPPNINTISWIIEQFRQLLVDLSFFSIKLHQECTRSTCDQMKTTQEWMFLCAAHKTPTDCCAVDYTRHTIDSAIRCISELSRLDSPSSRLDLIRTHSRRLVRILLHSAHHHADLLVDYEERTALCKRFCAFCLWFDIVPAKQLCFPEIPGLDLNVESLFSLN
ncbi:hypothetical protein P9112_009476 [Eukaryota sp. TZLM1-RC]